MNPGLFDDEERSAGHQLLLPGLTLLRHFVLAQDLDILKQLEEIRAASAFRHLTTPGGFLMSVAMTSCGRYGWVSDRHGYRYDGMDPERAKPWPPMPNLFRRIAADAAAAAGFNDFAPDTCLINRYAPGTRLSLHQDKNERDFAHPVVSVSLGLPAVFLFGGLLRTDKTARIQLGHADVVVWGGPARLSYHGVMPLMEGQHALTGPYRYNLTFRRAR